MEDPNKTEIPTSKIDNRYDELRKSIADLRDAYLELIAALNARELTDRPN